MTKKFCDVCGTVALIGDISLESSLTIHESTHSITPRHLRAVVCASFHFENHNASTIGGAIAVPIDLCRECRIKMLNDLWSKARSIGEALAEPERKRLENEKWKNQEQLNREQADQDRQKYTVCMDPERQG